MEEPLIEAAVVNNNFFKINFIFVLVVFFFFRFPKFHSKCSEMFRSTGPIVNVSRTQAVKNAYSVGWLFTQSSEVV